MSTIPHHTDALRAALARWEACTPGRQSDAWAASVATALRAIVADGYAVVESIGGLYLTRPAPGQALIPPRLLAIAGLPVPLGLIDTPTITPAPPPALAAEGPLTVAELTALSQLGWEVAATEGGRVRMNYLHADGWPDEVRTPGGWRAML